MYTDPDPFPPQITQNSSSTVCINSTNPEWSVVLSTHVTVYDNTGELIQTDNTPSSDFCLSFKHFPQSCAPFTVNATAHTQCSQSNTTTYSKYIKLAIDTYNYSL